MNKLKFILICLGFVLSHLSEKSFSVGFYQTEYMTAEVAKKKWGEISFDAKQFKSGDLDIRQKMVFDIVSKQLLVGKTRKEVRESLGDPDSYFFSDTIYAYEIMKFPGEKKEIWHLVFIPDSNLKKIKEVKIHKKCCYSPPNG